MKRILITFFVLIGFFGNSTFAQSPIQGSTTRNYPESGRYGMVVSQQKLASQIGADILAKGGNAVDAVVATGFALAVVLPKAGNIGGGGFMMLYLAEEDKTLAIDYREMAPAGADRDMFLDGAGNVDKSLMLTQRAAGVPGTVAGLHFVHEEYGRLSWAEVMAPAIKLAEEGFMVSRNLSEEIIGRRSRLGRTQGSIDLFFRGGNNPYLPGETFRQPDLAKTLRLISENGPDGFYKGEVADLIVAEMKRGRGVITHEDLENYKVILREPVVSYYKGHKVVSMPPPSSGGIHIIQILNILDNFDLQATGPNSAATISIMAEAMKYAYADRSKHLGDPEFYENPVSWLMSAEYGLEIANKIKTLGVQPSTAISPGTLPAPESPDTTHISIVDKWGNAVSNTYTINYSFGSGIVVEGAGFLLNNEMDDFSAKTGVPNAFGLLGEKANEIAPTKRPLSSMSPTIVFKNGKPVFLSGSPGGSRIITAVLQSVVNYIEFGMSVGDAVTQPRFHHQWLPDQLSIDPDFNPDAVAKLKALGYQIVIADYLTAVEAIQLTEDGWMFGFADRRRSDGGAVGLCNEDQAVAC